MYKLKLILLSIGILTGILILSGCNEEKTQNDDSIPNEVEYLISQVNELENEINKINIEHMREKNEILSSHENLIQVRVRLDYVFFDIVASLKNGNLDEIKRYFREDTILKGNKVIFSNEHEFTLPEGEYLLWQGHFQISRDGTYSTEYLFKEIEGEANHGRIHVVFTNEGGNWMVDDLFFDKEPW